MGIETAYAFALVGVRAVVQEAVRDGRSPATSRKKGKTVMTQFRNTIVNADCARSFFRGNLPSESVDFISHRPRHTLGFPLQTARRSPGGQR